MTIFTAVFLRQILRTVILGKISQANGRLKAAKVGVSIVLKGDRFYLQATLPPKPNSSKTKPHQQKLATGCHANGAGLSIAESEARKIGALLDLNQFSWEPYLKQEVAARCAADVVTKFEKDYFTKRARSPKSQTTWDGDYLAVFKNLPDKVLDANLLTELITTTAPDTRQRKRYCMALRALAKFAGIEFDSKSLVGNYSPKRVTPRDLPHDQLIAETFYKISNPQWQWAYGCLATWGLRPHEIFHLDLTDFPIATVTDGKTGRRRVWACYPEWAIDFDLQNMKLPNCKGRNNSDLGNRVTNFFGRNKLGFAPYDLRHAWAVRTLEFGLDISLAAQQMGHSVQVHTDIYHQWISDRHHQRAYELLMNRGDRPLAPVVGR